MRVGWAEGGCEGSGVEIKRESREQSGADAIKRLGHRSPCQAPL